MGLSSENESQSDIESTAAALREFWRSTKAHGTKMTLREQAPPDTSYANSTHPASRNDIQRLVYVEAQPVGQDIKDHNSQVSSLGHVETFEHLWRGRE
jgi:hypothetical protein